MGAWRTLSDPTVVDVHVHVFAEADDPIRDGYEIWEYGELSGVEVGARRGTVDDLLDALTGEPCAHCVVLGMFVPEAELARMSGSDDEQALPERFAPTTTGCCRWRGARPISPR